MREERWECNKRVMLIDARRDVRAKQKKYKKKKKKKKKILNVSNL
jgi:hypothetical protein